MTDDTRIAELLRAALPPTTEPPVPRDLWPALETRVRAPMWWSWTDVGLAIAAGLALALFPGQLVVLAFLM